MVKGIVDKYTWNWIDDWDNYSTYYDEEFDVITAKMTSSSRFGGSDVNEAITEAQMGKAISAWKRQYMERIVNDRYKQSEVPMIDKEAEITGYSRGAKVSMNGSRGIIVWVGMRTKYQFRDYTYTRDYMKEEVVKIDIQGTIHWIPINRVKVVNPEQYWVTPSEAEFQVNQSIMERGITWNSVIQHNGEWIQS